MNETLSEKEQSMRDYLLGKLGDEEIAARETVWFDNDEETERLEAVRMDLIDDFLNGSLPAGERLDFERRFLASPHNAHLVALTKTHRGLIDKNNIAEFDKAALPLPFEAKNEVSLWQKMKELFAFTTPKMAVAASIVLALLGVSVFLVVLRRDNNEVARIVEPTPTVAPTQIQPSLPETNSAGVKTNDSASSQTASSPAQKKNEILIKPPQNDIRPAETPKSKETPAPASKQSNQIAVLALALALRGETNSAQTLKLNNEVKTVQLKYEMPALMDEYEQLSVSILHEKSMRAIFEQKAIDLNLGRKGETPSVSVPAKIFENGGYQLVLSGKPKSETSVEILARYQFKIQNIRR